MPHVVADEFEHASAKLEFDSLLEIIAFNAVSQRSGGMLMRTRMAASTSEAERSQSEISEVLLLMQRGEDLPLFEWKDSLQGLSTITADGMAVLAEVLAIIADGERTVSMVSEFIERRREKLPLISQIADRFDLKPEIVERIDRANGNVDDPTRGRPRVVSAGAPTPSHGS